MELVIRTKGVMVSKVEGDVHAVKILKVLKPHLIEATKKDGSDCMAVYRINDDLKMTIPISNKNGVSIFLWESDTTIAVYS